MPGAIGRTTQVLSPTGGLNGHNALYIVVGLVWLYFADNGTTAEEEVTIREDRSYFYPRAGMFCLSSSWKHDE